MKRRSIMDSCFSILDFNRVSVACAIMAIADTAAFTSSPPPTVPECGERINVDNDTVGIFPFAVVHNGGCLLVIVVTGLITLFVADHDDDNTIVSESVFWMNYLEMYLFLVIDLCISIIL